MRKKQTNFQIYEQLDYLLKKKKPWSKKFIALIESLETEPEYPIDDPHIFKIIDFSLSEIKDMAPHINKKINNISKILDVNYEAFDRFQYNLLAMHLYDLSEHLYGKREPHLDEDELRQKKIVSIARLIESLAAICINNAQIM